MLPSTASFCLRCVCLIPYSLICLCLYFFGGVEWLSRRVLCPTHVLSNDSELLSSRIHAELARMLGVSATCQSIWRTLIHILCPSVVMREDAEYLNYVREGDKEMEKVKEEIAKCNVMLDSLRLQRLECLEEYPNRTEEFFLKLDQSQRLEKHLGDMKKNVEDRRITSQTRVVAKRTGYDGIVDWAERISRTHESLLQTTAQVAFVGAGLTYGSIFSASRGNIGLMCYAFALFDCGFIVPTVSLAVLKWASLRPKDTLFCSPHTWTVTLNILAYASVAAVGSAICLLNLTLYLLAFPLDSSGVRKDTDLQLSVAPTPAGGVSLICLLLSVGMVLFCVLTHYIACGWGAFVRDFLGQRPEEMV